MERGLRGLWCLAVGLWLMASGAGGQEPIGEQGLGFNSLGDRQADLVYTPVTPCRIIDTRLAGGAISAGTNRDFLVTGEEYSSQGGSATSCGVPAGVATAAMINFVAVTPAGPGNMQVTPYGTKMPTASFINYKDGVNIANGLAVVLCNPSAATCTSDITIRANVNTAHLVADVQGYFRKTPALRVDTVLLNTSLGEGALANNTAGQGNTAMGNGALANNTAGNDNTATGSAALANNVNGIRNTATGAGALGSILSGGENSAFGYRALSATQGGNQNSAFGAYALSAGGHWGGANSAFGYSALSNNGAYYNSAFGAGALFANTNGGSNAAFGVYALSANTTSSGNSAFGAGAATSTTGESNSAFGASALGSNTTGARNVAFGNYAGFNLYSGNDNIYIANQGTDTESSTIRIGTAGTHTATYIAGISGATAASGAAVYVNSSGQLGTLPSSARFKDEIRSIEDESDVLNKLRPVSFYYRPELDETHTRQYGLVAEEVAEVAPDLVAYDKDGLPQTVRYHLVNAMLLNEVQKQRRQIEELEARLARLEAARTGDR